MFDFNGNFQTLGPAQQLNYADHIQPDQFLTFTNPFLTEPCQAAADLISFDCDDSSLVERLHQLLKNGSMAIGRMEIENLINRFCSVYPTKSAQIALSELCLEINLLSGASADFDKRITVWFDSCSQRLNLKTGSGKTDCISIAHLLARPD